MAMPRIHTIPLFKDTVIGLAGTGGTALSDIIDLRDISRVGNFSFSFSIAGAGGSATAGSSTFEYLGCATRDGSFVAPTGGTFGTQGATPGSGIVSFSPITIPFMRIKAVSGTSNSLALTGELNVR